MLELLRSYAQENSIPIICKNGLEFLQKLIQEHKVTTILEIGTAIGYSALAMAFSGCLIDTFEKNEKMIELAKKNIEKYDLESRINLISKDALTYNGSLKEYDLIFIDGSKSQYQKFFEKYASYLAPKGIIVCDNLDFHNLDPRVANRNTRQLIGKINRFKTFLQNNREFITTFYDSGDGMSVSQRK